MLIDNALMLSNNQTVSSDVASTNYVDLENLRNIGTGESIAIVVAIRNTGGTSGTINFLVHTDDNTAFSSPAVIARTQDITIAANSSTIIVIPIPPRSASERYIRLFYDWTSGTFSVKSFITHRDMVQAEAVYPAGYTIQ